MGSRVVLGGERMVYHRKWGRATDFAGKLGSFSEGEKNKACSQVTHTKMFMAMCSLSQKFWDYKI